MPTAPLDLDCTRTVHDLIQQYPAMRPVFQRFGVDACCGGGASVDEAARRDGLDLEALCTALRTAAQAG